MSVSMKPGRDAVDQDVAAGVLLGHRLGEADEPGLAGRVVGLALVAGQSHDAGDVDDPPGPALHHSLDHGPGRVEGALQVGVEHRVPVVVGQPEQDVVPGEPGVVDQDVDRAQRRLGGRDRGLDLGRRRRRRRPTPVARSPSSPATARARSASRPDDRHLGARAVERAGDGEADAAGAAGDEGGLCRRDRAVVTIRNLLDFVAPCPSVTVAAPGTIRLSRPRQHVAGPDLDEGGAGRERGRRLHAFHPAHRRGQLVGQEPLGVGAGPHRLAAGVGDHRERRVRRRSPPPAPRAGRPPPAPSAASETRRSP